MVLIGFAGERIPYILKLRFRSIGNSNIEIFVFFVNTLRTGRGHLNCLNARSWGLNNFNQLLYCVSLKIYNKFANYFCELKFSGNTQQRPQFL